jgi:hypothetical protein
MPNLFSAKSFGGDLNIGIGSLLPNLKSILKKLNYQTGISIPEFGLSGATGIVSSSKLGVLTLIDNSNGLTNGKIAKKFPVYKIQWESRSGDSWVFDFDNGTGDPPVLFRKKKRSYIGSKNLAAAERKWLEGDNEFLIANGVSANELNIRLYEGDDMATATVVNSAKIDAGDGDDTVKIGFLDINKGEKIEIFLGNGNDVGVADTARGGKNITIFGGDGDDIIGATTYSRSIDSNTEDIFVPASVVFVGGEGLDTFYSGVFVSSWITDYEQGVDVIVERNGTSELKKEFEIVKDPNGNDALKISYGGAKDGVQFGASDQFLADLRTSSIIVSGITSLDQITFVDYDGALTGGIF